MSKKKKKLKAKDISKSRKTKRAGKKTKSVASPKPSYNKEYNGVLTRAQDFLDKGKNEEAIEEVDQLLTPEIREADLMAFIFASRISAFANANLKNYNQAAETSLQALKLDNNLLDFYYVLTFSYLAMEEYSLAEVYANKFFELASEQSQDWTSPHMMAETRTKTHLVYNFLGIALREQERFNEAGRAYQKSYKANSNYAPAYVNHAKLLHGTGDDSGACRVLDLAAENGIEAEEIKMLRNAYQPKPGVSVCMIVKNEEKMLDRCLSSVKGFADEIIVVDTGSTDSTVQIAESHGAKVCHHEWEDDFSKARNQSLQYATKEWIFILDADEELNRDDFPLLQELMEQEKYDLVSINVYNVGPEGTVISSFLPSIRMFRRETGAYYHGSVHNQLKFDEDKYRVVRANVRLKHYGYGLDPESMKRKVARSKALLKKQVAEEPDNFFAHFNLAQLYRGESTHPDADQCKKIIKHASVVVENADPYKRGQRHLHLMSLHQLATAYFYLDDYDKAIEVCKKAIEYKSDFLDPIITLGHIYSRKRELDEARSWFMKYLDALEKFDESEETDQIILLNLRSKHIAYYGLALISEYEGKPGEASSWFRKCLEEDPDYLDARFRSGRIEYNQGNTQDALNHLKTEVRVKPDNWAAYYIIGEIYTRMKQYDSAEEAYLVAFKNCDDEPNLLYSLARLYFETNRPEEAMKFLDMIREKSSDFIQAYRLAGDISFQFGKYREACAAYTNFVIRKPNDLEAWNNLGNSHFKLEEFEQAKKCYEKVIELDTSYGLAYRNLAVCETRLNNFENAYAILTDYLKLAGDDYNLMVMAAEIAAHLQKFEEAIRYIEKALGLNPNSAQLLTLLGDCYYAGGFLKSAQMGFEQALKVDPNFEPAKERLAQIMDLQTARKE